MNAQFMLCDKYLVKMRNSACKSRRLFAIFSTNMPGSQNEENLTYYVHGDKGIELVAGASADLTDLKWHQKETYQAGILGGLIGFISSLALLGLTLISKSLEQ